MIKEGGVRGTQFAIKDTPLKLGPQRGKGLGTWDLVFPSRPVMLRKKFTRSNTPQAKQRDLIDVGCIFREEIYKVLIYSALNKVSYFLLLNSTIVLL